MAGFNGGIGFSSVGSGGGGGGTPSLIDTQVAFGSAANLMTSSPNFTYDGSNGSLQVADPVSGKTAFFVSPAALLYQFGSFAFGNETHLQIDDSISQALISGNKTASVSPTVFTGTGIDDMSNATLTYTGSASSTTYTITIDGSTSIELLLFFVSSTPANPGDILLSNNGATGTFVTEVGGNYYITPLTGNWAGSVSFTNTTTTLNHGSISSVVTNNDTFSWTDGTTTVNGVPITTSNQSLNNGVAVIFGASTGHTVNDSWAFTYTVAFGNMAFMDGVNKTYIYGNFSTNTPIGTGEGIVISDISNGYYPDKGIQISTSVGDLFVEIGDCNTSNDAIFIGKSGTTSYADFIVGTHPVLDVFVNPSTRRSYYGFSGSPANETKLLLNDMLQTVALGSGASNGTAVYADIPNKTYLYGSFPNVIPSLQGTGIVISDKANFYQANKGISITPDTTNPSYLDTYIGHSDFNTYIELTQTATGVGDFTFGCGGQNIFIGTINGNTTRLVQVGAFGGTTNNTLIEIDDIKQSIALYNVPEFLNNAAAVAGSRPVNSIYKTTVGGDAFLKIVI